MNYRELQEEVGKLLDKPVYQEDETEEEKLKREAKEIANNSKPTNGYFTEHNLQEEHFMKYWQPKLVETFDQVRKKGQKWHQFVREFFYSEEELGFLKNDLLRLAEMRTKTHKTYFKIQLEKGNVLLPDRISQINKLHISFENF